MLSGDVFCPSVSAHELASFEFEERVSMHCVLSHFLHPRYGLGAPGGLRVFLPWPTAVC